MSNLFKSSLAEYGLLSSLLRNAFLVHSAEKLYGPGYNRTSGRLILSIRRLSLNRFKVNRKTLLTLTRFRGSIPTWRPLLFKSDLTFRLWPTKSIPSVREVGLIVQIKGRPIRMSKGRPSKKFRVRFIVPGQGVTSLAVLLQMS